jgi:hypothetical protein
VRGRAGEEGSNGEMGVAFNDERIRVSAWSVHVTSGLDRYSGRCAMSWLGSDRACVVTTVIGTWSPRHETGWVSARLNRPGRYCLNGPAQIKDPKYFSIYSN